MPDSSSPAPSGKGGQDEALNALLRDLRAELGDFGYQWLAACAVYPRLHWHLTVYLGAELARGRQVPPPDENAHLALARLPWFRKGSMPDDLRLRLLADLAPGNRAIVRQAIKRLFHRAMAEQADAADATFEIEIARRTPPPGWREALRRLLAKAEPDAPVHDAIFVRYMMGRMPRPIDLRLDRTLVRLFGARFAGWFDLTTLAALFAAAAIAVACWFGAQWAIDRHLSERTVAIPALSPLGERVRKQLKQVSCSILQASVDGGDVAVTGHAGEGVNIAAVELPLSSIKGVEQVSIDVRRLPNTYCNVLDLLKRAVIANRTGDDRISIHVPKSVHREGDELTFNVETLQTPSHVYIDFYMLDGYVQHLLPRPGFERNHFSNGAVIEFGRGGESGSWQVGAPFGTELLVVVSAPQPLFDAMGWEVERADDYLSALNKAFERLRDRPNEGPIVADIQAITTTPN